MDAFTSNELRQYVCTLIPEEDDTRMRTVEIIMHEEAFNNRIIYNVTERIKYGLLKFDHYYDFVINRDTGCISCYSTIDGTTEILKDADYIEELMKKFGINGIHRNFM